MTLLLHQLLGGTREELRRLAAGGLALRPVVAAVLMFGNAPAERRLTIKVPKDGIPGAPPRRKGRSRYSEEDCIDALRRFNDELPPSEPRTRDRYVDFASEHGLVSASRFENYGGFRRLMRKARRI